MAPADVPQASASSLRDLISALGGGFERILDVGAGGFAGDVTTVHLVDAFPDAQIVAVELDPDRADALRERFPDRVEVVTADVTDYVPAEPFDLVTIDLDPSAVPFVLEVLLERVVVPITRPGGVIITNLLLDLFNAYHGRQRLQAQNEPQMCEFMLRYFGHVVLTDARVKAAFVGHRELDALVTVQHWRDDPDNMLGWVALRAHARPGRWNEVRERASSAAESVGTARFGGDYSGPLWPSELRAMFDAGDYIALDLVADPLQCGPDCPALVSRWSDWSRNHFGPAVDSGVVLSDPAKPLPWPEDASTETVVPPVPLAMLEIPPTIEDYMAAIGAKPRNMVRKAERQGYTYRAFDYNQHLEEIFQINTSKPVRVGGPMQPHYLTPPRPASTPQLCPAHQVVYLGGFRDGVLLAYIQLVVVNELAVLNQILGHGDALPDGVMNGLVHHVVRWCIESGRVRAVNYLEAAAASTLVRFKHSVGFRDRLVAIRVPCSVATASE